MIMGKILSAQSILKQKGFVQNKFDTNGFMNAVGEYFLKNPVESRLLLFPCRFLDIERGAGENGEDKYNMFNVTPEEEKVGFKVQTEKAEDGWPVFAHELYEKDFDEYRLELDWYILRPRIIIDKPYFENAASVLRIMGGYVVEKWMKAKIKRYNVTLI